MTTTVPLGSAQVHLFAVVPGRAGEHRRLLADLDRARVTRIAVETEARHLVGLRRAAAGGKAGRDEPFLNRLARAEVVRRFRGEDVDPFVTAFKLSRERHLDFIPLLPDARREPGLIRRWSMRREAKGLPDVKDPEVFSRKLWHRLLDADARDARLQGGAERLAEVLFNDGASGVGVIAHAAHAERLLELTQALAPDTPLEREAFRETGTLGEKEARRYPEWR